MILGFSLYSIIAVDCPTREAFLSLFYFSYLLLFIVTGHMWKSSFCSTWNERGDILFYFSTSYYFLLLQVTSSGNRDICMPIYCFQIQITPIFLYFVFYILKFFLLQVIKQKHGRRNDMCYSILW